MSNKKVVFLKELEKKVLIKKQQDANSTSKQIEKKPWKNSIYGFECANYTSKC